MIENILIIGAWVFLVIGVLSIIIGTIVQSSYNGSIEEQLDAYRGIKYDYTNIIRFGFWAIVISLIKITANYI